MIAKALEFIREQLNIYLSTFPSNSTPSGPYQAILENVAILGEEGGGSNPENIWISLVNLSEEATMKNTPNYVKENFTTVYKNAPVFLNLFVLFACCYKNYSQSLAALSAIVQFFQGKSTFTQKNSVTNISGLENVKLITDLYSPTFEQVNYLWSTLGGKQRPFVLYKVRLAEVERESTEEIRGVIREVKGEEASIANF
jgi:hypothetical protein